MSDHEKRDVTDEDGEYTDSVIPADEPAKHEVEEEGQFTDSELPDDAT